MKVARIPKPKNLPQFLNQAGSKEKVIKQIFREAEKEEKWESGCFLVFPGWLYATIEEDSQQLFIATPAGTVVYY